MLHVPFEYPTIQAAVYAAGPGETISVAPGDYYEGVKIRGNKDGLTIESADPDNPFVIHGKRYVSRDGVRIDRVDGVTLRNFHINGAYDGVRLVNTVNSVVIGLHPEDNALHVRVNRGSNATIVGCTITSKPGDRGVEQGILVDHAPGSIVVDNVIDGAKREGIRLVSSPCVRLVRNRVTNSRGSDGIQVLSSAGASVEGCTANGNSPNGFLLSNSPDLVLIDNAAFDNRGIGIRLEQSSPYTRIAELLVDGNVAGGNPQGDVTVRPASSDRPSVVCPVPAPTITPRPAATRRLSPTRTRSMPLSMRTTWRRLSQEFERPNLRSQRSEAIHCGA